MPEIKMRIIIIAALAIISTAASAQLIPIPAPNQKINYNGGYPSVVSAKLNIVGVTALPNDGRRAVFQVGALNETARPANLGSENVTAFIGQKPIRVLSYEDLVRKARIKDTWGRVAAGMAAGAQAGQAIQPSRSYIQGTVTNPYGAPVARYDGYATTYDPAAVAARQQAIQASAAQQGATLDARAAQTLDGYSNVLRTTTLQPREQHSGVIYLDGGANKPITLVVRFNGERHNFVFTSR
ncbi:MAG: hypothetical protein ACR2NX_12330 [Chthoniobacterales bacterium]